MLQNRAVCNGIPKYLEEVNALLQASADRIRSRRLIDINKNKVQPAAVAMAA